MGITDFWGKALGTFVADTPWVDASEFSGKRFAVDSSIWFNRLLRSNIDQLATTSTPPCLAPDLLFKIKSLHDNLSQCNQGAISHLCTSTMAKHLHTKTLQRNIGYKNVNAMEQNGLSFAKKPRKIPSPL